MEATLKFSLPEEEDAHKTALKGKDYYCILFELQQELRGYLKYGHKFNSAQDVLEHLYSNLIKENLDD